MNNSEYLYEKDKWLKGFSDIIYQLLGKKDISINKAADYMDIDSKTLRLYLNRKSVPTVINLMKIADFFNVSTDYLIYQGKCDTGYSDSTVIALATLIKNFDVSLEKDPESDDIVTLKVSDKVLSTILKELYLAKNHDNFSSIAGKLAKAYGNMKVYKNHLVDFATFQNLIQHEYIYHDLEDELISCTDENGNSCCGADPYTFDEIEKRLDEWEKMNIQQREEWWNEYSETTGGIK